MNWLYRLLHRQKLEQQLDQELQFHIEAHAAGLIGRGVDPAEARRQARLALGGPEQVKEDCRDVRGTRWLEDFWQDFRYTLRSLRRQPGFAAVILLTLALGTGAVTVMFTVTNGVLLKPLPYAHPERLLQVQEQTDKATRYGNLWAFAYPNYLDCRRASHTLTLAAAKFGGGTMTAPGEPENVNGVEISANFFDVLGVPLARGRSFRPDEDQPSGTPVIIISDSLWRRSFGGDTGALGGTLVLDGTSYTVVGITRPDFRILDAEEDIFTPLGRSSDPRLPRRSAHPGIQVMGRLNPGFTPAQARAELNLIGRDLARQFPDSNAGRTFIAAPLSIDVGDARSTLWLLLGAVTLVLLIACANIASLLLSRALARERELAMRVALGAGRARLVRQCLTESAVLGICGGAVGVLLAWAALRPFIRYWPGGLPRSAEVALDGRVLAFALALSLASSFLFGLVPALRVPVHRLEEKLRSASRSLAGGSHRMHGAFVVSEIALAVVLLISAGMLGRALLQLSTIDPGLNVHRVLTARASLSNAALADSTRTRIAWQEILERARRVPGVEAAAIVDTVPMREGNNEIGFYTTPTAPPDDQQPTVSAISATPDYLQVMRIHLRAGRFFDDQDRLGQEPVVVIDEVMARQAFGGQNPIGKQVWIGLNADPNRHDPSRVIGVVDHVRYWGPAADDRAKVRAQLYYPLAQVPDRFLRRWSQLMSLTVRTSVEPGAVLEPLRRAVAGATGDQVLYEVRTMEQLAASMLARQRFLLLLFGMFGALALLLACIGIYGVLAYLTSRRIPEFGLRMAMGATSGDILRMILRQSAHLVALGAAAGIAGAVFAGRALASLVEGVPRTEALTAALMIALLALAAMAASYLPARRASRIDPMRALRQE